MDKQKKRVRQPGSISTLFSILTSEETLIKANIAVSLFLIVLCLFALIYFGLFFRY